MKLTFLSARTLAILFIALTIGSCTPAQMAQLQKTINQNQKKPAPKTGTQPQQQQQQPTANRKNTVTYPPNPDRIKPASYTPAPVLTVNVNPNGVRYKDYVFAGYDVKTEYYQRNAPNYDGSVSNLIMDIFTPKNDTEKKRPCIVYIFGGGFYMKVDDGIQEMCKGMVQKGYVVACIDYRIGFKNSNLSMLCIGDYYSDNGFYEAEMRACQDARSAIRYLKANAERLGIDPDMLIVGGQSAGAITALNSQFYTDADVKPNVLKQLGGSLDRSDDNNQFDHRTAGIFQLSGCTFNEQTLRPNKTPLYLLFGSCDEILYPDKGFTYHCGNKNPNMPYHYGGRYIYNKLKGTSPVRLDMICKGGHGPGGWGYNKMVDWVTSFTYSVITGTFKNTSNTVYPNKPVCNKIDDCQN